MNGAVRGAATRRLDRVTPLIRLFEARPWLISALSLSLSVCGVALGVVFASRTLGSGGGVLGVAASFTFLFLGGPVPSALLKLRTDDRAFDRERRVVARALSQAGQLPDPVRESVTPVLTQISLDARFAGIALSETLIEQDQLRTPLALASVFSTLAAGFGGDFALWVNGLTAAC